MGANARPIPMPPTAPPNMPMARGTEGTRMRSSMVIPVASSKNPERASHGAPRRSWTRAATQAPMVQQTVATVTASDATSTLCPRTSVTTSGTKASTGMNAAVSMPRRPTVAAIPRRNRKSPGVKIREAQLAQSARPVTAKATPAPTFELESPVSSNPAPAVNRAISNVLNGSVWASLVRLVRRGTVRAAAKATNGRSPRNTHRQPNASLTIPAIPGPTTPGMTHAVEVTANIRTCPWVE